MSKKKGRGWYGDKTGHRRAAIKGWRNRRKIRRFTGIGKDKRHKDAEDMSAVHERWGELYLAGDKEAADLVLAGGLEKFRKSKAKRKTKSKQVKKIKDSSAFKTGRMTKKEFKAYIGIAQKARKAGLSIPRINLNKGPLVVDEVNIPETYATDAFFLPDTDITNGEEVSLVLIHDDASDYKKRIAFAHELGHVHMDRTREKDTELKADKYAAKILGIPLKEVQEVDMIDDVFKNLER